MSKRGGPSSRTEGGAEDKHGGAGTTGTAVAGAQARESAFLELLPTAALILDGGSLAVLEANQRAGELLGNSRHQLRGMRWPELLRAQDRDAFPGRLQALETQAGAFTMLTETAAAAAIEVAVSPLPPPGRRFLLLVRDCREQRQAEQALRFSEERYRRAYQRNLAGIYRTTLDGRFLDCNPAMARMFGFVSTEELMQTNAAALYFDRSERERALTESRDGQPHSFEALLKKKDGAPLWVLENMSLVEERPGAEPVIYGTLIDITERNLAEQMLRASEAHIRELIEGANDIIYTHDLRGRFTWVNEAAVKLSGYSIEEIRQKDITEVLAPEYRETAVRQTQEKLRGQAADTPYLVEIIAKNGERLALELNTRLVYRDGVAVGVQGIARDVTPRQRAEEALRESENKFRVMAETAPCAIFIYDAERLHYVNPASEAITGYSREELLRKKVWELVHPEERETIRQRGAARMGGKDVPSRYEFRIVRKDGGVRWLDFSSGTIPFGGGVAALGTGFDVTERKRAEKLQSALYEIAEKATAAEDLEKCYVAIHRIVGELLYANNFYIALLNEKRDGLHFVYAVDEVDTFEPPEVAVPLGNGCSEYVLRTGQTQLISDQRFAQLCAAGETEEVGAPSIDWLGAPLKTGDRVFGVLVVQSYDPAIRFHESDKEILNFVSQHVAAAIERKRNLEALRESEARYRSLVDSAVYGIFRSTIEGRFLSVNPALVRMLGYETADELLALDLARDVYADAEDRKRILDDVLKTGAVKESEARWKRKDGGQITVRLSGRPRRNAQEKIEGFEIIAEDVSERRVLEDQLRQSQKMEAVGRLAGGLAHDFNNLLTVIKGYSELMEGQLDPNDPLRSEVREVHRAAERAAALTRQLLAFSRQQVMAPRVLDLNQVVGNMDKLLRRLLGEDVKLFTALDPRLGRVKADPGQIEQVIMNLAVNARDAMPHGGKLTLESANAHLDDAYVREHVGSKAGDYVMLAVSDSGEGMPPEVQSRIFEPFFTTKEMGKGTGLGLSTVYGIIKQSQGYIWVYSEVGMGTTFKIYLPRVDDEAEAVPTVKIPAYAHYQGNETILLVEDEDGVRALIRQVLHKNGYTVLEARHGGEALLICERHPTQIDLLLTDVVLEQMGGPELAARLGSLRPEMKVLFMSGYTDEAIVKHGVLTPGTAFLQKPFTTDALARKVRGVLDGIAEE